MENTQVLESQHDKGSLSKIDTKQVRGDLKTS